ncbi:GPR1/FUN34/YaaH-class plasma membrane protein [Phlyctema vagabunda]|uniref:GPR1/FUN34/YaaH-class plasma membrane protein n=1 Tax=Phlyctema vagabunda TaxID=108571 RepID=A0ABR4PXV3_9HELO
MSTTREEFYNKEANDSGQSENGRLNNGGSVSHMEDLRSTRTNLTLTPEMFEKLYLSPKNSVAGELRKTFGNPTPIALIGLVLAITPLSAELMGWRGAAGFTSTIGVNYFFGGFLMVLGGILEFFLGNTYPCVVFCSYGAYFFSFAATFDPRFAAISSYTTDGSQTMEPPFMAGFGFFTLSMGMLSTIYLVCAVRVNLVFVSIFASASMGFYLVTGAFWQLAQANTKEGNRLLVGTGASFFVTGMMAWYLLLVIMLATLDFPFSLPVGDLSGLIKGASDRAKIRKARQE